VRFQHIEKAAGFAPGGFLLLIDSRAHGWNFWPIAMKVGIVPVKI
jgi:hypothetical protein